MKGLYTSRCALCDGWYNDKNPEHVREHQHPGPQSGPLRDAWLKSGLAYERWADETAEGKEYKQYLAEREKVCSA